MISSISISVPLSAAASSSTAAFMRAAVAMPVRWARCRCRDRTVLRAQLIDIASITALERDVTELGRDPSPLWASPEDWGEMGAELDAWIERAGKAIAQAVIASSSVVDFEAAIIDGWMPASVRARIVDAVRRHVETFDLEGIQLPAIFEGTVGIHARALGAASLPLSDRYLLGQKLFRKGS